MNKQGMREHTRSSAIAQRGIVHRGLAQRGIPRSARAYRAAAGFFASLFLAAVSSLPLGCGSSIVDKTFDTNVSGRVTYEKRVYDPYIFALSADPVEVPATGRPVIISLANGAEYARTVTDSDGRFTLPAIEGEVVTVTCLAGRYSTDRGDGTSFFVRDPGSDENNTADDLVHNVAVKTEVGENTALELKASLDTNGGAFAIAEAIDLAFSKCSELGLVSSVSPLPELTVYWKRGKDTLLGSDSSFYVHPPSGSSQPPFIFIDSFPEGSEATESCNEWNPGTVIHEFGHYITSYRSRVDSLGGLHYGVDEMPMLAWSEGIATYFEVAARRKADYWWFTGYGSSGSASSIDLETSNTGASSSFGANFSELAIAEILVDAHDGPSSDIADRDGDPLNSASNTIWTILLDGSTGMKARHFVTLADFAEAWQSMSPSDFSAFSSLLSAQGMTWPVPSDAVWPVPIASTQSGSCDSNVTSYYNSVSATDDYEIVLSGSASINLTLNISGSGAAPGNLDLYLYNDDLDLVAVANSENATESVSYQAPAGHYLAVVRAAGSNNSASYTLSYSNALRPPLSLDLEATENEIVLTVKSWLAADGLEIYFRPEGDLELSAPPVGPYEVSPGAPLTLRVPFVHHGGPASLCVELAAGGPVLKARLRKSLVLSAGGAPSMAPPPSTAERRGPVLRYDLAFTDREGRRIVPMLSPCPASCR